MHERDYTLEMTLKKLWNKSDPAVTAVVVDELNGVTVARVSNPHMKGTDHPEEYLGFILLDEWSDVEQVPVPLCAAEKLFVAVLGKGDPDRVTYVAYDNEVALRVDMQVQDGILGFFEVSVPASMTPNL